MLSVTYPLICALLPLPPPLSLVSVFTQHDDECVILFFYFFLYFCLILPTPYFFSSIQSLRHIGLDHLLSHTHTHTHIHKHTYTHTHPLPLPPLRQHGIRYSPLPFPSPSPPTFSLGNSPATQPSGTALEHAGTLIKTGPPGACKMAGGLNRKQSQSHRKSLLSDSSPGLPGFLSGSRQWARDGGRAQREKRERGDWTEQPSPRTQSLCSRLEASQLRLF